MTTDFKRNSSGRTQIHECCAAEAKIVEFRGLCPCISVNCHSPFIVVLKKLFTNDNCASCSLLPLHPSTYILLYNSLVHVLLILSIRPNPVHIVICSYSLMSVNFSALRMNWNTSLMGKRTYNIFLFSNIIFLFFARIYCTAIGSAETVCDP